MESREGIRFPRTRIIDGFELPYGCWELSLDPLDEQLMLLTTDPSLQPHIGFEPRASCMLCKHFADELYPAPQLLFSDL